MRKIRNKQHSKRPIAVLMAMMGVIFFLGMNVAPALAADDCPVIDDMPLGVQIKGSPSLIMFTIDDSGSMSYSITLEDQKFPDGDGYNHWKTGGMFKRPGGSDVSYIFDDPGDHTYNRDLKGEGHLYWYTQFFHTNKMFYNPSVTYAPWPRWDDEDIIEDAPTWSDPNPETEAMDMDPDNPRSNPMKDNYTVNLDRLYYATRQDWGVIIDNTESGMIGIHQGIVIDNKDDTGFTLSDDSEWSESGADDEYPDPTHEESSYYANDEGDWAEWTHTFTADEAGIEYYVEVWFCHWNNRDDEAQYTITYDPADGSDDTVDIVNDVSQRDNDTAGSWQNIYELGDWDEDVKTYTVAEGDTITVRVERVDDDDDGSTSADAVRFLDVNTPPMYLETETEDWDESGSTPEWRGDSSYTEETGATATWTHQFSAEDIEDGSTFLAQAWWNCYDGRNENAQFTISKNDVDQDVVSGVNQREGTGQCGRWVTLGDDTFTFSEGDWGAITLEHTSANNGSSVADAIRFISEDVWAENVDIQNSHYYIHTGYDGRDNDGDGNIDETDENDIYLVNLVGPSDSGEIDIYRVTEDDGGKVIALEEKTAAEAGLEYIIDRRSYEMERVNFANWFSFHRRRLLTAKNAIGNVITDMQNVYIGLLTIHKRIKQPVLPVNVSHEGDTWNETQTLLKKLYRDYKASGGTPLREALKDTGRYFQGDYMESDIYESYTTSSYYPFYEPVDGGECQQSFCILMTDGFWNGDSPNVGNEDQGGTHNTDYDGGEFADGYSNTLADVAMLYYEIDLNSNLENLVQAGDIDPATHQRMVTYGLSFGAKGTLDPSAYPGCPGSAGSCPTWPDPTNTEDDERIDDLYHAAINGRGLYLNAGSPDELLEAMRKLKEDIEARGIRTEASAAVSSQQLKTDSQLYVGGYNTFGWAGTVTAWDLDETDGSVVEPAAWNAGDLLETRISEDGHGDRIIATSDGSTGYKFRDDQSLDVDVHEDLTPKLINYIRGDKDQEQRNNGSYRNRLTNWAGGDTQNPFTLGDIVHSSPVLHKEVLYVGANDGMLHAFLADDGSELFAYVPAIVHPRLKSLADANQNHKYYVDLTPAVRDVGGTDLLVGGLGKGGKGYFALDVTDAKTDITSEGVLQDRVLWEFTGDGADADNDGDDDDMGYAFSQPVITETDAGFVVVFGNGYGSENGEAILYVLTDPLNGTDHKTFSTGVSGDDNCNGMSTPFPADVDNDGKTEFIYVGDLKGNLWKFDVRGSNTNAWRFAFAGKKPLFTAMDSFGNPQPITGRPDVTDHCSGIGQAVVFGTGQLLGTPDVGNNDQQTLYGIWDFGDISDEERTEYIGTFFNRSDNTITDAGPEVLAADAEDGKLTMLKQELETGSTERVFTDKEPSWETEDDPDGGEEKKNPSTPEAVNIGWYFDLPAYKERIVQPILIRSGKAIVVSNVPGSAGGVCTAGESGTSYLMAVDPCTGGRTPAPVFDINDDGEIDDDDLVSIDDPDNEGETIDVPPGGVELEGLISGPAITYSGEIDYLYTPTNPLQPVDPLETTGANIGMTFWRQHL